MQLYSAGSASASARAGSGAHVTSGNTGSACPRDHGAECNQSPRDLVARQRRSVLVAHWAGAPARVGAPWSCWPRPSLSLLPSRFGPAPPWCPCRDRDCTVEAPGGQTARGDLDFQNGRYPEWEVVEKASAGLMTSGSSWEKKKKKCWRAYNGC
jgi:hypothetical protein